MNRDLVLDKCRSNLVFTELMIRPLWKNQMEIIYPKVYFTKWCRMTQYASIIPQNLLLQTFKLLRQKFMTLLSLKLRSNLSVNLVSSTLTIYSAPSPFSLLPTLQIWFKPATLLDW